MLLPSQLLLRNYPNPFNSATKIEFQLPHNTKEAFLSIYNLRKHLIRRIMVTDHQNFIWWHGKDNSGLNVNSGIYLYQLRAGEVTLTKNGAN
ncbi:MAG: FlgD immunoglobulin-like domain containing protein [Candidatus Cloacimonadota bacterium]|nr:FlgD immunoglobulin-like domain containing protein [Candidatus Cloacimonadota bacterium]